MTSFATWNNSARKLRSYSTTCENREELAVRHRDGQRRCDRRSRRAGCATLVLSLAAVMASATTLHGSPPSPPCSLPDGYPFPDYPTAGASHPRQAPDYMRSEPDPDGALKRVGQYALRLIQTGRAEEAVRYADGFRKQYPGRLDGEMLFMRAAAQGQLGDADGAARSMRLAIEAGLPPERFLAGPRCLFEPLADHAAYVGLREQLRDAPVHGPMLGAMTDRGVRVWVRTADETPVRIAVSRTADLRDALVAGPVRTRREDDFTAIVRVDGLEPDTEYHYAVLLGEAQRAVRAEHQRFRTFPPHGRPARFRIAFGGGAGYVPPNERMWDTLHRADPLAVLLLGDNVYIDDPESLEQHRYCYYQRQSRPEFRRLAGSRAVYAIWDDHDFAMDDSWGGPRVDVPWWKPTVWEIFTQNWVNPAYGGGRERPGVWFDFRIADVHFIMLDGRYYRTDAGRRGGPGVEAPTMLGPDQLAWLERTLERSEATFKVLVSPVPWTFEAKPGQGNLDTWYGYRQERERIFRFLDERRIEGVALLSADRHRSDAWKIERTAGYPLYEFNSSRLTNQHTHPRMETAIFSHNATPSFGLVTFSTVSDDPTVTCQVVSIDGQVVHTLDVRLAELKN
jgi:alkaline phosphatase D